MTRRRTARQMEASAAQVRAPRGPRMPAPGNEALAMLVRRGLRPRGTRRDLPFPPALDAGRADRLAQALVSLGLAARDLRRRFALVVAAGVTQSARASDKVVTMLADELIRRSPAPPSAPRRVERDRWALTPHLYAVNAK